MTDKNDALFLVSLPFGQKTIPYGEVSARIATAKSPGYDCENATDHEGVMFALGVMQEEGQLKAAVRAGEVEVLNKSFHRISPHASGVQLENALLTVQAFREYLESIHGLVEVEDAPERQQTAQATDTTPAQNIATPAPVAKAVKRKTNKPSLESVALDYMRHEYKSGQFKSAAVFHKHLIKTARVKDSPFEMGTGTNARKLFCPAAGSFFDAGTLGKVWKKIRAA